MRKADHLLNIPYAWTESDAMQQRMAELAGLERKNVFGFGSQNTHPSGKRCFSRTRTGDSAHHQYFYKRRVARRNAGMDVDVGFAVVFVALFSLTLKIVAWINTQYSKAIGNEAAP